MLKILACLDSVTMAAARRQELDVPRNIAAALGRSAVEAAALQMHFFPRMSQFQSLKHGSKSPTRRPLQLRGDSLKLVRSPLR